MNVVSLAVLFVYTSLYFPCHVFLIKEVFSVLLHRQEQKIFQTIISLAKLWALALI